MKNALDICDVMYDYQREPDTLHGPAKFKVNNEYFTFKTGELFKVIHPGIFFILNEYIVSKTKID